MEIKELLVNFVIVFAVVLVIAVIVTYLWNLILHGSGAVDWNISLVFALSMGIALPVSWALRTKEK
jgi:hypothetical protein